MTYIVVDHNVVWTWQYQSLSGRLRSLCQLGVRTAVSSTMSIALTTLLVALPALVATDFCPRPPARGLWAVLSDSLWAFSPEPRDNQQCSRHSKLYRQHLANHTLWAVQSKLVILEICTFSNITLKLINGIFWQNRMFFDLFLKALTRAHYITALSYHKSLQNTYRLI